MTATTTTTSIAPSASIDAESPPSRTFMQKVSDCLLIVLFLCAIALPVVGHYYGFAPTFSNDEMRAQAPLPALPRDRKSLAEFPAKFDKYFNDNFGFRAPLIRAYSSSMVWGLHDSPSERVVLGKDGWLFFDGRTGEASDPIADYRKTKPLSAEQLKNITARFAAHRDFLRKRGIAYAIMVVPNKETIYPELLPDRIAAPSTTGDSPIDQLARAMASPEFSDVTYIDLRDAMKRAKNPSKPLYLKSNTHWNDYGAYIAYRELIKGLKPRFPQLNPLTDDDVHFNSDMIEGGDLAKMMDLAGQYWEPHLTLVFKKPTRGVLKTPSSERRSITAVADAAGDLPELIMVHDSFTTALIPFLKGNFSRGIFDWTYNFDYDLIDRERPTVVVEQVVERMLRYLAAVPETTQPVASADLNRAFDAAVNLVFRMQSPQDLLLLDEVENPKIDSVTGAITVTASGVDPKLEIREFKLSDTGRYIVRLKMTAPQDTLLQIFWHSNGTDAPLDGDIRSVESPVQAGQNILFLPINDTLLKGSLRIDPGMVPGDYTIESIEIRSVGVDKPRW